MKISGRENGWLRPVGCVQILQWVESALIQIISGGSRAVGKRWRRGHACGQAFQEEMEAGLAPTSGARVGALAEAGRRLRVAVVTGWPERRGCGVLRR